MCVQMKSFNKLQQPRWQLVAATATPSIQPHVILSSGEHIASFFRFLLPVSMHLNASQHCHFQIVVIQYQFTFSLNFFLVFFSFLSIFLHLCHGDLDESRMAAEQMIKHAAEETEAKPARYGVLCVVKTDTRQNRRQFSTGQGSNKKL